MVRELIAVETAAYMRALARQQMQTVAEKIGNSPS
jgi:hypothetical protein